MGSEKSFAFASQTVRRGGKVIIVGLFGGAMSMPLPHVPVPHHLHRRLDDRLVAPETLEMMKLVREGKIDPIPYSKRPLNAASQTLDDLREGKIVGRVVLTP